MKQVRMMVALLLALACAGGARADAISAQQAAYAASAWAKSGTAMARQISATVAGTTTYAVTNGYSFHAVRMDDGVTIFTSSDDAFEPIIAFTANPNPNLAPKSPLRDLLESDVCIRAAVKEAHGATVSAAVLPNGAASTAKARWSALLDGMTSSRTRTAGATLGGTTASAEGGCEDPASAIDDVRVAPLLSTKWSQSEDDYGNTLYNYYTPNNYACGCTATASGQIMCYFRYPTASMPESVSYLCTVDNVAVTLKTMGGLYDWDRMVGDGSDVNTYNTEEQRQAIGKLLYDIGVVLQTQYGSDGSGALTIGPPRMFRSPSFGYKNAYFYTADPSGPGEGTGGLHNEEARKRCIYANLDAKRPVQLSIGNYDASGDWADGHSVVGDGYGYKSVAGAPVPYVHINLGWAGQDDAWYNLPEVDAKTTGSKQGQWGLDFKILSGCVFNISPSDTGDILSGRVTDDEGAAAANVTVKAYAGSTLKATTQTDAKGIYAFTLPGGEHYRIAVEVGGVDAYEIADVRLPKTSSDVSGTYAAYCIITNLEHVGNSWGNDIVMGNPCVRNVTQGGEFSNLNLALTAAADGDVLEVFGPAMLKRDATLEKSVTIRSSDLDNAKVSRVNGATLTVASGATLTLSNVIFTTDAAAPAVFAKSGGHLALAGSVGLGEIMTSDAAGIVVAGALTAVGAGLTLNCSACSGEGEVFGTATCDLATAGASAQQILNKADVDLYGAAKDDSGTVKLYWKDRPADPATALAYATGPYHDEGVKTTYYNSLTKLFRAYTNGAEVVLLQDAAPDRMTTNMVVSVVKPTTIRAASGTKTICPSAGCCFRVLAGGTLGVTNIVFDGAVQGTTNVVTGTMLRKVGKYFTSVEYVVTNVSKVGWSADGNGQFLSVEGGELTLGAGVTVQNFTTQRTGASASWSTSPYGPILLKDGALTLGDGVKVTGCHAAGNGVYGSCGGGIAAEKGRLELVGATIKDCSAFKDGGAVYAGDGVRVRLEGKVVVSGNTGAGDRSDDVYLAATNTLPVVGALVSGANVGFRFPPGVEDGATCGNFLGCQFAVADGAEAADVPAALFSNVLDDDDVGYAAELEADTARLVWTKSAEGQRGRKDADGPLVKAIVTPADGSGTSYWTTLENALNALEGDAEIQIKKSQSLKVEQDVEITHNVRIFATNDLGEVALQRTADYSFVIGAGASLSLSNLVAETVPMTTEIDGAVYETPYTTPLFYVNGGALTCDCVRVTGYTAAAVTGVNAAPRRAGAVCVWNGGDFTMRETTIQDVHSTYVQPITGIESATGGGVLVEGYSTAHLESGMITNCWAQLGGALRVDNSSEVWLGDVALYGNYLKDGDTPSNVLRDQTGKIHLTRPTVQKVGLKVGPAMILDEHDLFEDTNVVVELSADWTADELKAAAGCFRRDPDGCVGKAVTNATEAFVVWRTALTEDDLYVDARGVTNALVGRGERKLPETAIPVAEVGLIYNGFAQTGVVVNAAFDAGIWEFDPDSDFEGVDVNSYYAVVRLKEPGYLWEDGSSDSKRIRWSIAQKGLRIVVGEVPDWNLAEHSASEKPGYGAYVDYFESSWHVEGVCDPPDATNDVITGYGYYQPGGLLSTSTTYKVWVSYTIHDNNYLVTNTVSGTMRVVSNEVVTAGLFVRLSSGATAAQVQSALAEVAVADPAIAANVTNAAAYADFVAWAQKVKSPGAAQQGEYAVAASPTAYVSYEFGVTTLFANDPSAEIQEVSMQEAADGSALRVAVTVKDGEDAKAVVSAKVKEMFEQSSDLENWTSEGLEVEDLSQTTAEKVEFTVKPSVGGGGQGAFVRLRY